MPKITIIAVGKIKERYVLGGIGEYMKRMRDRVDFIEVKDSNKAKEGDDILKKLERFEGLKVALDEHGDEMTSLQFADFAGDAGRNTCFVIGGPDGLSEPVLKNVDKKIALSRMTFNHEMARLFLVEQLYRAFSILDGKRYHRG